MTVKPQKGFTQHHSEVKLLCSSHGNLSASAVISGDKKCHWSHFNPVFWCVAMTLIEVKENGMKIRLHPFVCL